MRMKKLLIILTAVVLLVLSINPFSVFAENRSITTLDVSCVTGTVSYSGTVASGVKAVAVLLFASDGNLLMMDTCEVNSNGEFSGELGLGLSNAGEYTVKASDYEGGSFTEKSFSQYSIIYHLNGGTNNEKNPGLYSSTESVSLMKPTRKGYHFLGWYTDCSFTIEATDWSAGESGDKTLYAKWRKISYASDTEPTKKSLPTTVATFPAEVSSVSTTVATLPTEVSSVPTTVAILPTEVSSVPTTVSTVPTTASPVPTTAKPEPTTIPEQISAPAQESITDVDESSTVTSAGQDDSNPANSRWILWIVIGVAVVGALVIIFYWVRKGRQER